ncbi:hypothetical protein ABZ379_34785 [Streptomyces canus]
MGVGGGGTGAGADTGGLRLWVVPALQPLGGPLTTSGERAPV